MKGLELHRSFFEECGKPLLIQAFPEEFELIAVGSVGYGSDRLGADDECSQDHCWEPGFQIFSDRLPQERLQEIESYLFEHLPWDYKGFQRTDCLRSPNGIRAWTVDEFFKHVTSFSSPPTSDRQWLLITDEALCHATNGEVFHDPSGDYTRRREAFGYYPDNVWFFKLTGRAFGISVRHYEMKRLLAHGEEVTADLMLSEGLREVFHFICLVNRRYAPHDRWLHWMARQQPILAGEVDPLVTSIRETTDIRRRLSLYAEIMNLLANYVYENGLAARGEHPWVSSDDPLSLWRDLYDNVTGDLKEFPFPSWVGVEYKYGSQCGVGDFREFLGRLV